MDNWATFFKALEEERMHMTTHKHKTQADLDACGSDVRDCGGLDLSGPHTSTWYGVFSGGRWFTFESGHHTWNEFRRATLTNDPIEADRMLRYGLKAHANAQILKVRVNTEILTAETLVEIQELKLKRLTDKLTDEEREILNVFYQRRRPDLGSATTKRT